MSTENLVTGKFYRILKDATNDVWDRISFWTHADDVQTASGITLTSDLSTKDTKISATQNDFATIETSSVSAHAYVIGNMLVYNNQLYRATSAIAVGATLVPGTNIEEVSVGTLSNMLSASNGNGFYFDVKDNKYGFYPNASKTASEFVPFGGTTLDHKDFTTSITVTKTVNTTYVQNVSGSSTINVANGSKTIVGYGVISATTNYYSNGVTLASFNVASLSLTGTSLKVSCSGTLYAASNEVGSYKLNYTIRVYYS